MLPTAPSVLPKILDRAGPLPAVAAVDGEPVEPGRLYVARPDLHLLLEDGCVRLVRGPKENRHRPAIDASMRSAAVEYGPRCVGVVLSGSLSDGTAGLAAVKRRGGVAVVQDPEDALFPSMPRSALERIAVDHALPAREIGPLIDILAREEAPNGEDYPVPDEMELEARIAKLDPDTAESVKKIGTLSSYTCPECDGPLWEMRDGSDGPLRFRCRVGRAYAAEDMLDEKTETLEGALWAALNNLKESAEVCRRLAGDYRARGHGRTAERFDERADSSERQVALINKALSEMRVKDTV
jgi:two-component system chemotaxis response regulator CheB